MAAFTHPIAWFLELLRLWLVRERQAVADELQGDAESSDLYHERNTCLWYLPPPC